MLRAFDAHVSHVHAGDRVCLSVVGGEGVVTVFGASWDICRARRIQTCVSLWAGSYRGMGIETYSGEQIDIFTVLCINICGYIFIY